MSNMILLGIAAEKLGWEDEKWMKGWPDALTLEEIAQLEYTDNTGYRYLDRRETALITILNIETDKGLIDWIKPEKVDMHPSVEGMLEEVNLMFADLMDNDKYTGTKLIGREDYRHWDGRPNPPSDFIKAWLGENSIPKPENIEPELNDDKESNAISNDFTWNVKRERDVWVEIIEKAARELYSELRYMPSPNQVWIKLIANPPIGYSIKYEDELIKIPGESYIGLEELKRRWSNYTKPMEKA